MGGGRHGVSRSKSWNEGGGIRVEGVLGLLLVGKMIVTVDGSSHRLVPVIEKMVGYVRKLIVFFLWIRVIGVRGEVRDVEHCTRSSGVRKVSRS